MDLQRWSFFWADRRGRCPSWVSCPRRSKWQTNPRRRWMQGETETGRCGRRETWNPRPGDGGHPKTSSAQTLTHQLLPPHSGIQIKPHEDAALGSANHESCSSDPRIPDTRHPHKLLNIRSKTERLLLFSATCLKLL